MTALEIIIKIHSIGKLVRTYFPLGTPAMDFAKMPHWQMVFFPNKGTPQKVLATPFLRCKTLQAEELPHQYLGR